MDCQCIEFSSKKSQQRIDRFLSVFGSKLLNRIIAFSLYLLGAKRNVVASLVGMPENTIKTMLGTIKNDGFTALRDRRQSIETCSSSMSEPSPLEWQVSLRTEGLYWILCFGNTGSELKIPQCNHIQLKTVLLSFYQAGLLSAQSVSTALGVTSDYCRKLADKLVDNDVEDVLVDKRQRINYKEDYEVDSSEKSEIIKHFAALAVTGHSTSSSKVTEAVNKVNATSLSSRTVRRHMRKLGLTGIKKTLPKLVDELKKNCKTP
jgi:hypothetical protein